ncbi:MAG: hypothetical protein AAF573_05565 [Bacteroidota bacterium]
MKTNDLLIFAIILFLTACSTRGKDKSKTDIGTPSVIMGKIVDYEKYPNTKFVTLQKKLLGKEKTS